MSRKPAKSTEEIKEDLRQRKPAEKLDYTKGLSTGSTLLNLACTGRTNVGFLPGKFYFIVGDSKSGKAQPLDAKILTPGGWKRMGKIKVGDDVCDPGGGVGKVIGVFPQGLKQVYRVTFSDGGSTRCCGDHLWTVRNTNDIKRGTKRVKTTKDLEESLSTTERFYIPLTAPVQFARSDDPLPINPYLLGVLIGNGHLGGRCVHLSTCEGEILSKIRRMLPDGVRAVHMGKGDYQLSFRKGSKNLLLNDLRSLGLSGHLAHDKFIPKMYLRASIDDRMILLNGLMDTDGYVSAIGELSYSTSSPKLARDVVSLVQSLGGRGTITSKPFPKYTYKGEERTGRPAYSVFIRLPDETRAFTLKRKAGRTRPDRRGGKGRKIVDIQRMGEEQCRCIAVSCPSATYITDDFIVTHNTWLSLTCFAEACLNPAFKDYRLIFDNVEDGALMDWEKFFGREVASRVEAPSTFKGQPHYSSTLEEFYYHLDDAQDAGKPFIYVLDSMDAVTSGSEKKKFQQNKKVHDKKKGKAEGVTVEGVEDKEKGSMGDGKAKINSSCIRMARNDLQKSGSILIVINQTRTNIGFGAKFNPQTRSGGLALTFYATLEIWSSIAERVRKVVRGKSRVIGIKCRTKVKKNRISGRERQAIIPILYESGFDDTGSMVDFLVEEGHWACTGKEGKGTLDAIEFGVKGSVEKVITEIERQKRQKELRLLVATVWADIEEACVLPREKRYT